MDFAEHAGDALGRAVGPVFAAISRGRHSRTFHPRGDLARATIEPLLAQSSPLTALGRRLAGAGLIRFSNALWKHGRWPDALGCALACLDERGEAEQHLLFATIRRPWTMPFAPFTTAVGNYLANDYFAVSPFDAAGVSRIWLRLSPVRRATEQGRPWRERRNLLEDAISLGDAALLLSAAPGPWKPFVPFARITPTELLSADPPGLKFDPFLDRRGLTPVGFVHALRHGAYAGSRDGRHADALPASESTAH
ncbi:MAG: hypothetical protein IPJ65_02500 [Archangiaceae bacterium]|nr:hypothetical protein [Archangiaceae bacterium]